MTDPNARCASCGHDKTIHRLYGRLRRRLSCQFGNRGEGTLCYCPAFVPSPRSEP